MGYDQGCMTVLSVFLEYKLKTPLGGVICIGGLLPLQDIPPTTDVQAQTPMNIYHGDLDRAIWI